ncbi:MAG: META domain-containing protein [Candidatus Paceibacterota bacterium]
MKNKNKVVIASVGIMFLFAVFFTVNSYVYHAKQADALGENKGAEQSKRTLTEGEWVWKSTRLLDGSEVVAPSGERFVLTFNKKGEVGSSTDCNGLGGNYVVDGEVISFSQFISTMMYCEGSLESTYSQQLMLANSYAIKGDTLTLMLNRDYGVMEFEFRKK